MQSTLTLCLALLFHVAASQNPSPENICDLFLQTISVKQGEEVNWKQIEELCVSDVIFRAIGKGGLHSLNLEQFRNSSRYSEIGFKEIARNRNQIIFGNIASVTEEFEAEVISSEFRFEGMNMYHLAKIEGHWKITEIIYQMAGEDLPLPSNR